jgi:hypothetical protein
MLQLRRRPGARRRGPGGLDGLPDGLDGYLDGLRVGIREFPNAVWTWVSAPLPPGRGRLHAAALALAPRAKRGEVRLRASLRER